MTADIIEVLKLGIGAHRSGKLSEADACYTAILEKYPLHPDANHNMGILAVDIGKASKGISFLKKAVEINPKMLQFWLSYIDTLTYLNRFDEAEMALVAAKDNITEKNVFDDIEAKTNFLKSRQKKSVSPNDPPLGELQKLVALYTDGKLDYALDRANVLTNDYPHSAVIHNVDGAIKAALGNLGAAIKAYKTSIQIKPDFVEAQNNLGIALTNYGKLEDAISIFKDAIRINPHFAEAFYNLGKAYLDSSNREDAVRCYKRALAIKPDYAEAAFNLAATTNNISDAKFWIKDCLSRNPTYLNAILHEGAIALFEGDDAKYINFLQSPLKEHPFTRSLTWISGLPKLPKLCFDKWAFFDSVIDQCRNNRPFYEFGVWRGKSFEYLFQKLGSGYGFDTFTGLPEDWHNEKAGSYSADGNIPRIEGGKFIVGKFEDSLPKFFSRQRPLASIINFDADLYSSTLCALNFSKRIIDNDTILIFDEFVVGENWEEDEFKALNEFCQANSFAYEVLAISFFSKQVALRLLNE